MKIEKIKNKNKLVIYNGSIWSEKQEASEVRTQDCKSWCIWNENGRSVGSTRRNNVGESAANGIGCYGSIGFSRHRETILIKIN
tara:strand:- start:840 stop:1091 length:252 start_codon:yes stop_codon:yes gene_type:complete